MTSVIEMTVALNQEFPVTRKFQGNVKLSKYRVVSEADPGVYVAL